MEWLRIVFVINIINIATIILHIKNCILRAFLLLVLLAYLFMPLKSQIFSAIHFLSHSLENVLQARHNHTASHIHNFQLPFNNYQQNQEHAVHHKHSHVTKNHTHKHNTLSVLASIFSSEENQDTKKEGILTFHTLDKHFPSDIYKVSHKIILLQKEKKWGATSNYFSIHIPIILPPPEVS